MDGLPSMWRTELWHPLVVHFPIALLLVGTALRLLGGFRRRWDRLHVLAVSGRVLLGLGTIGAWAAIYTGTLADAEVARSLCDPTVVEAHEFWAYRVAWLFTAALALDAAVWPVRRTGWGQPWSERGLLALLAGCLLLGSVGLGYVGHLGSKLVYQQGAAVHTPAPDCKSFE